MCDQIQAQAGQEHMKITVDLDLCQGHSVCMAECPEVFQVIEQRDGYPVVSIILAEPPETLRETVTIAAKYCPNKVITIND